MKAGLVNNPPAGIEGDLYAEIGRSKPAPQGICVANSDGKVLAWALSFDDEQSLPLFLDYALERYDSFPDAADAVTAERFMRFPGQKLDDVDDNGRTIPIPSRHIAEERCPALPALQAGTLVGQIVGRALDEDGRPLAATLRQEHYMEARFDVPPDVQERFIGELDDSGESVFHVSDQFARLLVSHAYLGQLDVNPLGGQATGGQIDSESIEFQAQRISADDKTVTVRVTGSSDVSGGPSGIGVQTDGRQWVHHVQLEWEGYVTVEGDRLTELVISAAGTERLRWGNRGLRLTDEPDIAHLMAGHPIDLECGVRYGLLAQPCSTEEVVDASAAPQLDAGLGVDQLVGALGPRFLILVEQIGDELDLAKVQRDALAELRESERSALDDLFQQLQQAPPEERPRRLAEHQRAAMDRLNGALGDLLNRGQLEQLRRVELRQQGLFALTDPATARELQLTDEQQRQIVEHVREMQQQAQVLQQQDATGADPQQLQREMQALRTRQEQAIAETLSDSQRAAWRELSGVPE